ncbi:DUF2169 family type VI secretion system accessory protein [Pyxidicoccus xibeiensis]|uniref:DUF2169 family type VI secretion system accessory protein n=1 Tax=Pyxidicoccus xibeiensis TaxID=2906759 RepID=UPI0020A6FE5E|nr:DUF2169 domain-containing protein [Pyxidicoccus xibeiensis]MCP3143114.1 DUF2169 domain-containing protein [Pyxidicoccus xibeiensis]
MGHPALVNRTPFFVEPLFLADEEARPLLVPVVKATFDIAPDGTLSLSPEQLPLNLAGERWEDADTSSYRFEPEGAFFKPATDVVLLGHAHAPAPGTRELLVSLRVGPLRKDVKVTGDRAWFKSLGSAGITRPLPFERMPLRYERAFGGWDRSEADPKRHTFEPRNPVGVGFHARGSRVVEGAPLPNLEAPDQLLRAWDQHVAPAGFGFISPEWQPRASFAGTYGPEWEKGRKPLLPRDFDRRFLNAASPGLIAAGYLRGDEPVLVQGATPRGALSFRLPAVEPPLVSVRRTGNLDDGEVATRLDTVILDLDASRLVLLWRGTLPLRREPTELREVRVECDSALRWGSPPPDPEDEIAAQEAEE